MAQAPKDPLDHEPEAVAYAREMAGLTKADVARALGVSLPLISMIESGDRNATPAMQMKMARLFNCPRVILQRKRYPDPADETSGPEGDADDGEPEAA